MAGWSLTRAPRQDELLDPRDHLVDVEARSYRSSSASGAVALRERRARREAEVGGERVRADLGPLCLSALCAHPRVGLEVDLHLGLGGDDGADVPPFDHGVAIGAELPLAVTIDLAHLGVPRDHRHHAVDPNLADRVGDVGVVDQHPAVGGEDDGLLHGQPAEPRPVAEVEPAAQREPGEAPVHGAGVEVAEPEPGSETARDGALAGAGGSRRSRRSRPKSWSPGPHGHGGQAVEEAREADRDRLGPAQAHALARRDAGDRPEHRDAVVAGGVDQPPP